MKDLLSSYPLTWPVNWKRTTPSRRTSARFSKKEKRYGTADAQGRRKTWRQTTSLTTYEAVNRLIEEISRLGVERGDMIISTNVQVKLDGTPYSNQKEPSDPGAAVYWRKRGQQIPKCMAIDRYDRVADNLAAIAATISAMRMIERHGGAEILERAFLGFQQLPPPFAGQRPWHEVLEFGNNGVTLSDAEERYKFLAKRYHPDHGGDPIKFAELADAIRQARETLKGGQS